MSDLSSAPEATEAPQPDVEQPPRAETPDSAQPDAISTADATPPDEEKDDKKTRRHVSAIQNRIDELTRARHEERRRAEAAETQLRELQTQFRTSQSAASEPKIENYQDYGLYLRDMSKWQSENVVAAKLEEFAKNNLQTFQERDQQERAAHAVHQFDSALQVVEQNGAKKYPDFVKTVTEGPRLGPQIGRLVLSTEHPDDISYYLAKNPEHAVAIASMEPYQAAREIGKLEAKFDKRVTSAPKPPTTVGNKAGTPSGLSDELPADEWYKRRQAQLNRKA